MNVANSIKSAVLAHILTVATIEDYSLPHGIKDKLKIVVKHASDKNRTKKSKKEVDKSQTVEREKRKILIELKEKHPAKFSGLVSVEVEKIGGSIKATCPICVDKLVIQTVANGNITKSTFFAHVARHLSRDLSSDSDQEENVEGEIVHAIRGLSVEAEDLAENSDSDEEPEVPVTNKQVSFVSISTKFSCVFLFCLVTCSYQMFPILPNF